MDVRGFLFFCETELVAGQRVKLIPDFVKGRFLRLVLVGNITINLAVHL